MLNLFLCVCGVKNCLGKYSLKVTRPVGECSKILVSNPVLLVVSCWVPCVGLASHPGGVVIVQVVSYWVPCDGLASH